MDRRRKMSLEKVSVDRFFIDNHICLCAVITGKPEVYSCAHAWLLWQRSELQEEDEEDKITALQHAGHMLELRHPA